jgi:hypothetical protein
MISKERAVVVVVILAIASLPALGQGAEPSLKSTLEKRYADMRVAMDTRDAKALGVLLAPGFVSETVDGKTVTADAMMQDLASAPKDPNKVSTSTLADIRKEGSTVTVEQHYHGTTTRPLAQGGAAQMLEVQSVSTDTWVEVGGVWLLKRTVTRSLDVTVDGKQMVHKQHAPPAG